MPFTVATIYFFPSQHSCVGPGGEEWPTAAVVLYKIKVCFGVRNESLGLSPGPDNHCRIYCPLSTLTHKHVCTHTYTNNKVLHQRSNLYQCSWSGLLSEVELNLSARDSANLSQGHRMVPFNTELYIIT